MAIHHFCTEDAIQYGIEEAILLWNIGFWCATNLAKRQNIHDGNVWTYNPHKAYLEITPYVCPRNTALDDASYHDEASRLKAEDKELKRRVQKVKRIFKSLESKGAIVIGNYNRSKYDRTSWYALANPENLSKYAEISMEALRHMKVQNCTIEDSHINNQATALENTESTNMYFEEYRYVPPIPDSKHRSVNQKKTTTREKKFSKISFDDFLHEVGEQIMVMRSEGGWFDEQETLWPPKRSVVVGTVTDVYDRYSIPSVTQCAQFVIRDWVKSPASRKPVKPSAKATSPEE